MTLVRLFVYLFQFIEWIDEIYMKGNSRIQICEEQVKKLIVHFSNVIPPQCSGLCVDIINDDILN